LPISYDLRRVFAWAQLSSWRIFWSQYIDNDGISVFLSDVSYLQVVLDGGTVRHEEALAHGPASELTWHKGIACESGACVEAALRGEEVFLRSSLAPEAIVALSRAEWRTFLTGAKEGRFDHL
jgi:hypothetical protein